MADRQRGVQIHRGIIYGSHARLLSDAERKLAPPELFLTSATSPPPSTDEDAMNYLPGGADDMSYLLKKVTFKLHETYANPNRAIDKPPYQVSETGWGEFTVQIRLQFVPESSEKPITVQHPIKLHHWGAPVEGIAPPPVIISSVPATAESTPVPTAGPSESTPAPSEAAQAETQTETLAETQPADVKDGDGDVKMEADTPATVDAEGETDDGAITAIRPDSAAMPAPPLLSIANKLPVHAWQYDELVFSDPPLAFYNILCDHPPTPLPGKNRRARDQREEHAKKKKGRVSTITGQASRGGTPSVEAVSSVPPATAVPAAGMSVGVGIPGEPGSADVPLEFTAEMEKGEWNRLHEAKKKIIEEMDRWRIQLIEEEKELQKLKEEMNAGPA